MTDLVDIQRRLLSAAVSSFPWAAEAASAVERVAHAFTDPTGRAVAYAIRGLVRKERKVEYPAIYNEIVELDLDRSPDIASRMADFLDAPPAEDIDWYVAQLRQADEQRRFERVKADLAHAASNGATAADLIALTKRLEQFDQGTDDWRPLDMAKVLAEEPPPRDWLFIDTLGLGDMAGLAAQGGSGKTFLALTLAVSAATGAVLLPTFKPQGAHRVLFLAGEDSEVIIWGRLRAVFEAFNIPQADRERCARNLSIYAGQSEPLTAMSAQAGIVRTERYAWLRDRVRDLDPSFVVVDPKARFDGGEENDAASATAFIVALQELAGDSRTVLVLHHVSKALGNGTTSDAARGSTAFRDGCRWFASMAPLTEEEAGRLAVDEPRSWVRLDLSKANYAPALPGPVYLQRCEGGALKEVDLRERLRGDVLAGVATWLADQDGVSLRDVRAGRGEAAKALREYTGATRHQVTAAVDEGLKIGRLKMVVEGRVQYLTVPSKWRSGAVAQGGASGAAPEVSA